jgi:hypothetical protein
MKRVCRIAIALLAGAVASPTGAWALAMPLQPDGQSFAGSAATGASDGEGISAGSSAGDTPSTASAKTTTQESSEFAQGTQAINQSRWTDAVRLFSAVAAQHGDRAEAALYWKAYAQSFLSQSKLSLATCGELKSSYPKSRWIDDCDALTVEINARAGKHVQIKPNDSDDVKLLEINAMMRQNEQRALDEIAKILNGDSSQKLKDGVLFILNDHHDAVTYPQIARISYTEGDVRVARGAKDAEWEQARADLPLETGFTISTGNGRAEIELENASTLYLAENSVLVFNDLETVVGKPVTKVGLLAGTVTLRVRPFVNGEVFYLQTPTDHLFVTYGQTANLRITSYMDAMAMTALEGGVVKLGLSGADRHFKSGETVLFHDGQPMANQPAQDQAAFAAWDRWVANRYGERAQAAADVMRESGLPEPIPGVADLANQGKFFSCPPFGTCWEPASFAEPQSPNQSPTQPGAGEEPGAAATHSILPTVTPSQAASTAGTSQSPGAPLQASRNSTAPGPNETVNSSVETNGFPCLPETVRYRLTRNVVTGQERVIDMQPMGASEPWAWAVCHAGSWIRHDHHYAWVAGHRRHHHAPVMWVKSGKTVAIVPLHPHDVAGHVPINHVHEVFAVNAHGNSLVQPLHLDAEQPVQFLAIPPKDFRDGYLPPLARAEEPHPVGHELKLNPQAKGSIAHATPVPLHFDNKTQSFMMSKQVTTAGKTVTMNVPVSSRSGDLQGHSGSGWSGGSHSGYSAISSGGSAHGGYSSGVSSGGGAGASHSSGGGGASSSGSSSGVSSSSVSSSSSSSSSAGSSGSSSGGGGHK